MIAAQQPIVSITIPTYNRSHLLKKTLVQLFKEIDDHNLHGEVEIVISDNCSTDNTTEIVNEYITKSKYRIVYNRNEQNLGVIKNILKLIDFSNGKYWMFYGDDDVIPTGNLKPIVENFKTQGRYSAFMYKWPTEANKYCKDLTSDTELSYEGLAKGYFYYIGNAGIFAVETEKAKEVVKKYSAELINTCWPQTIIIFLALFLSGNRKIKFIDIVSSIPPEEVIVISNCYYLFETSIYAMLRTAISIEKITKQSFVSLAINSMHGIQDFESIKLGLLDGYCFYDTPKQQSDFSSAVTEAHKTIPAEYRKEIDFLYRYVTLPKLFLKLKLYRQYMKETEFSKLNTGFINKLKIMSPFGFHAIVLHRKKELENYKLMAKKTEVESNSGYF
jgi:glycosyltransferase involved in cell wall biosynthesis